MNTTKYSIKMKKYKLTVPLQFEWKPLVSLFTKLTPILLMQFDTCLNSLKILFQMEIFRFSVLFRKILFSISNPDSPLLHLPSPDYSILTAHTDCSSRHVLLVKSAKWSKHNGIRGPGKICEKRRQIESENVLKREEDGENSCSILSIVFVHLGKLFHVSFIPSILTRVIQKNRFLAKNEGS